MATAEQRAEAQPAQLSAFQRIKAILGGSAGNLVEWYDWFAYTSTSLYFAKHFFPGDDAVGQQLIVTYQAMCSGGDQRTSNASPPLSVTITAPDDGGEGDGGEGGQG